MMCLFGMNERLGLARSAQRQGAYHLAADGTFQRDCSERTAEEIDEEVKKLLDCTYAEAKGILTTHRDQLELVTEELLKRETLDGDAFKELLHLPKADHVPTPRFEPLLGPASPSSKLKV